LLPASSKLLPREAGSFELRSLLALIVKVHLGNTFVSGKSFRFILLSSFQGEEMAQRRRWNYWYARQMKEEIEIHAELVVTVFNIQLLFHFARNLSSKMVAIYFKLALQGYLSRYLRGIEMF